MQRLMRYRSALFFAGVLALAGCQGEKGPQGDAGEPGQDGQNGAQGEQGPQGLPGADGTDVTASAKPESCAVCHDQAGFDHQGTYDRYKDTPTLAAAIESVVSTPRAAEAGTFDVTVTFSLTKNGAPYDVSTTAIRAFAQKTVYATKYDATTRRFDPTTSLSVLASLGGGRYTAKNSNVEPTTAGAPRTNFAFFAPESSDAMVYAYFAENPTLIAPKGNYKLYDDVASVAQAFGALAVPATAYVSAANVAACEKCHGSPYMKHGYRAGAVAGIPDMAACKACHYDTRNGSHRDWQCLVDDPAAYAAGTCATKPEWASYAYLANTMNDTHMSHAMEFAYPQSMANCVTCHDGKLDMIFTDANFTLATCKSCHPVTGPAGGTDPKRAPALLDIIPVNNSHTAARADLYTFTGACNGCHAGQFASIHSGRNKLIYAADGTRYSSTVTTSIDTVAFDSATNILTVNFSTNGAVANALFKPTVVISLYGYDTKDFIVGGHASTGGVRNLEATFPTNNTRMQIAQGATSNAFVATANLSTWASRLADGSVKLAEIGILPALGLDPLVAPQNTALNTDGTPRADYNPYVAIGGVTKTFDLVGKAVVADADAPGKAIVDTAKCNACHDALGTTFHSPSYGGSGVVACRLCHVIGSGGSHLEMQSRSIDSYIHAIHSFQVFDIGDMDNNGTSTDPSDDFPLWDFTKPLDALRYEHHVASTFPNFTLLNCESCHTAPTAAAPRRVYDVPDQSKSLPGLHSKADVAHGWDRTIGAVPAYVTGPASRACGGCHRAKAINENDGAGLAAFNGHTEAFGYMLDATDDPTTTTVNEGADVLDKAILKIMSLFE